MLWRKSISWAGYLVAGIIRQLLDFIVRRSGRPPDNHGLTTYRKPYSIFVHLRNKFR